MVHRHVQMERGCNISETRMAFAFAMAQDLSVIGEGRMKLDAQYCAS